MATRTSSAVLLCCLCLLACSMAAQGAKQMRHHRIQHRNLQQFRPNPQFPFLRCGNFSSKGLPYYLEGPYYSLDATTSIATYTFRIGYKGPNATAIPCYQTMEKSVSKLMLSIYTECQPAVQVAGFNATLNGKPKAVHVYEYPLGSSLTISKLGLDAKTADGALVSISASVPCNTPRTFFKPNTVKNVPVEYSFTESNAHKCCPRSV